MDFANLVSNMGVVGFAVMGCLLFLSVYSGSVILAKYRRFKAAASESQAFTEQFGRLLKEGKFNEAAKAASAAKKRKRKKKS